MSYKFDSLMLILNKLDRNENVTVHSLMDNLEVSQRSIYRYIQTLQVAGFPIHYDRKRGSYCFVEGYSLKQLSLSLDESLALALSKKIFEGSGIDKSLNSIEEKLLAQKGNISEHIVLKVEGPSPEVGDYLKTIHQAIIDCKRLKLVYQTLYSNEESVRNVDPHYLFFSAQERFWFLRAYCHLRKELRAFALDKIISLKVLNEHFLPVNISKPDELASSFGTWLDEKPVNVSLRFDAEVKSYILRKRWHDSQKNKELEDGRLEVSFKVTGLDEMKEWIYRWIPHVEVMAPKKLKDIFKADIQKALKKFK